MFYNFESFLNEISNKKIAFIGTGISNMSIVKLILKYSKNKFNITLLDLKDEQKLNNEILNLKNQNVKLICGPTYLNNLTDFDVLIRSPGIYFNKFELKNAIKKGSVVTSELELFFDMCPCKTIGITGSDGKTTTTSLIAKILETQGFRTHLGGNIGTPLLEKINEIKKDDIAIVELSSFQLISMRTSPDISVITNISPNHLDVHKTMQEYVQAKSNILLHQNAFGTVVLNANNQFCENLAPFARGFVKKFSINSEVENGAFYNGKDKKIYYSKNMNKTEVVAVDEITIKGTHNIENYLAAISATFELTKPETIKTVAKNFKGIEHRLELVKTKDNINWFNDSIATTPTRTIAGLNCFDEKIILIAGGYDKQISFNQLAEKILEKVKVLILIGSTSKKIESAIELCKNFNLATLKIEHAQTMSQAISIAKQYAKQNDNVVLSPACASFDMFENFEQRGNCFKKLVQESDD